MKFINLFPKSLIIAGIIVALLFGTWIRWDNLFHTGFYFDVISTQYTWGKAASELGIIEFWKSYDGYYDYLPGALYLDTVVYKLSLIFGGSEQSFATLVKSLNWIVEIVFCGLVYVLSRYKGNYSRLAALALTSLVYILPSFWFISAVWGQIDSLVVLLALVSMLLLWQSIGNDLKRMRTTALLSGLFYGLTLWIKMQPILLLPIVVLILLLYQSKKVTLYFMSGVFISTSMIIGLPLFVNSSRLVYVAAAPFLRDSVVSRSAVTFWTFIGATRQDFLNEEFHRGLMYRFIAIVGFMLYALFSFGSVVVTLKVSMNNVKKVLIRSLSVVSLFVKPATLAQISLIATVSTVAYFEFMVKMYERYLHFGTMLSVLTLTLIKSTQTRLIWLSGVVLLNIGNFINVLGVYDWWGYEEPIYLTDWYKNAFFPQDTISAICTLGAFSIFCFVVWKSKNVNEV